MSTKRDILLESIGVLHDDVPIPKRSRRCEKMSRARSKHDQGVHPYNQMLPNTRRAHRGRNLPQEEDDRQS